MKNTCLMILTLWVLASCSSSGYQQTERGVVVSLQASSTGAARQVRVEVMGEQLMHVSATPEQVWSEAQRSRWLAVIPASAGTDRADVSPGTP